MLSRERAVIATAVEAREAIKDSENGFFVTPHRMLSQACYKNS